MVIWFFFVLILKKPNILFFCPNKADEEEDEEQAEKIVESGNDHEMAEAKQPVVTVNDDDEPMAETINDENLNNGSPDEETQSQKNDGDNSKELADGEIADLSGDESKAADAPETIDLGKFSVVFFIELAE